MIFNGFESRIFPIRPIESTGRPDMLDHAATVFDREHRSLKILIPKERLQRLPIALAQVKAGNISVNFLNEIR